MLALSRKLNESVVIGGNIEVTILEIKGDQVKVGISAPRNLPIYRKEIYAQIQEENKQSAGKQNRAEDIKKLFG
jgi:carbon storage regulator